TVTQCGACARAPEINLSTALAGQNVGVKQIADQIWPISFMAPQAFACVLQQIDRARARVVRGLRGEHGAGVRGEALGDLLAALAIDIGSVEHVPSLPERERVADSKTTLLSGLTQRTCERAPLKPQPIRSVGGVEML